MTDIRQRLNAAAGHEEPLIDFDALRRRADLRRQRRRVAVAGLGAAAVLAVSSFVWAAGSGGAADQQVTAGNVAGDPSPLTGPDTTATTEPETTTFTATTESSSTTGPTPMTTAPMPSSSIPAATTTVPAPTSVPVTTPATTIPPAGGLRHLAGTHRGEGLPYEPTPGGCKEFAHRLDSVFTLDTGEGWNYHADYCGEVDSSGLWTGAGTFTFTTPAGDHVMGTFTSRAMLPTKGEPYGLKITNGTGLWADATGTCYLTNHVKPLASGLNEQAGDFACDIQPSARSLG